MASELLKFFSSKGKSVKNDPEEIRKIASLLLSDEGSNFQGAIGQSSAKGWASSALAALDSKDGTAYGGTAYDWITGAMQPKKASNVWNKFESAKQEAESKVANELSNIANITDFSNPNLSSSEKAQATKAAEERQGKLNSLLGTAELFGIDTSNSYVKDSRGNYVPASEIKPAKNATGALRVFGEGVDVKQVGDGWGVVGKNTGKVYQQGLGSFADAESWAHAQFGGTADKVGAFDTGTASGGTTGSSGSSILPSSIDTTGLSTEQIKALEQTYLDSSSDTSLASKLTITDTDVADFLKKAQDETNPYYNQIYSRAKEDYERGLKYKAENRTQEMAQEQLNAQVAMEQSQSQSADAGLAFSGIRAKTEQRLKEQADNIARASRRAFNEEVTQFGRSAEDLLGSKQLANASIPQIEGTNIYTPSTGVTGSVEREQITAEQTRAAELEKQQRLRNLGSLPESSVATEDIASLF